jgi:hypothetical protein
VQLIKLNPKPGELIKLNPKQGEFYDEMCNYFYLAQLRAQGEDSTEARDVTGRVPVDMVPDVMVRLCLSLSLPLSLSLSLSLSLCVRVRVRVRVCLCSWCT